jgi:hypothetical protein
MKRSLAVLVVAVVFAWGAQVFAHHSFAATYMEDREISIEGELMYFLYRNPHSFLQMVVHDPRTKDSVRWAIEWVGSNQLRQHGMTRETLKVGDHVVITGRPGRNPSDHRLRLRSILRPKDGWRWGSIAD